MKFVQLKKGDLPDMLIFLTTVFILAIGLFILAFVIPTISDGLAVAGLNDSAEGASAIAQMSNIGTNTIQRGFFLIFVGLIMSTMITSFFARTHPVFLFLYIIFLAITIFLATYLGNAYETLSNISIFADTLASQSLINLVMQNIVKISLGVGALSMVILFSKFVSGRGRQDI
ncbi:hypothetical protein LCGC14_0969510 [marine sediment metagenome]|uniref:Uncharacterized protein n=1 Tax=marine sediment metagenome TaxID=412755 RepID=A0A0F9RIF5_9ZZZZ